MMNLDINKIKENRHYLGIILSFIGILIWGVSILTFKIWWVDPKYELGLFQALPVYFWLAISLHLIGTLIGIESKKSSTFIFQIIILNLMIWGTPIFIEPNARILDAWTWLGTTETILNSGHIYVNSSPTHFYLQWPGSFVFNAILLNLTQVSPTLYLQYYPLLATTIFILGYYLWIKNIIKNKAVRRFSIILFIFLNVWLQFHFSPQAFGLMLLPLILLTISKRGLAWKIVLLLLFTSLLLSHPTTTLFLLIIVFCYTILKMWLTLRWRDEERNKSNKKRRLLSFISILSGCLIISILVLYLSSGNFERLFDFDKLIRTLSSIISSRVQHLSSIIRIVVILLTLLPAVLAIVYYKRNRDPMFAFTGGWLIGCTIPLFADLTMGGGGFHDRSLMFAYLIIPLLVIQFIWTIKDKRYKHIVLTIIILLSIIGTYTLYSNENGAIVSDSCISTTVFFIDGNFNNSIFGDHLNTIFAYNPETDYDSLAYYTSPGRRLPNNALIVIDEYTLSSNRPSGENMRRIIQLMDSEDFNRIYSNNNFQVYLVKYN